MNYLFDNGNDVKNRLLAIDDIDPLLVKMFVYSLGFDIEKEIKDHLDDEDYVVSMINRMTCIDRDKCVELSKIYLHLYSEEQVAKRINTIGNGLNTFARSRHKCIWKGASSWVYTNGFTRSYVGIMECEYVVCDCDKIKQHLKDKLIKNPYFSNESIEKIYNNMINNIADNEFDDYVKAENIMSLVLKI